MMGGNDRTLSLDPGETTGWAILDYPEDRPVECLDHGMQIGSVPGIIDLFPVLLEKYGFTRVVCESFILDGRTAFPNLTPLQVEGALMVLWAKKPAIFQRNTYKRFCPDAMLEKLGWLWPGAGHDRDAGRHGFALGVTLDHRPTTEFHTLHG